VTSAPRILVVGGGSAGTRHGANLAELGARVSIVDPRSDRREDARERIPRLESGFESLDAAIAAAEFDAAVVATPTALHVEQSLALIGRALPLLLEKPVAPTLLDAKRLASEADAIGVPVLLGYTYRWWPPFVELRRRLGAGEIGTPRHARFLMSAHLADWHPWERYQDFFMSSAELGGGALLDESHFLDLMLWLFGMPAAITGRVERISELEISSDDNVDVLAAYASGLRVAIHLDLYGRPHERSVTVVGEEGTLQVTIAPNELRRGSTPGEWERVPYVCERNDMFVAVAHEFLELVGGTRTVPSCTTEDGLRVLECVESIRSSSATGRTVEVGRDAPR